MSISKRATNKPKNNSESINKSKITANDEIMTFDDPALEKAVLKNFEKGKPADEPLTKINFSNFYKILAGDGYGSNGNFDVDVDNPTSLKELEALKYLTNETPDGAPTVISLTLHGVKSDISLKDLHK